MEYLGVSKSVNSVQPLVSICVPTFQHAPFIATCLDSILMQETDFPYEILIGEDDSKDGTRDICIRYAEEYPDKIRLFLRRDEDKVFLFGQKSDRINHLGLYASVRGKYVCICDGDDFWVDNKKLQHQVDLMEKFPNAALCITNTKIEGDPVGRPIGLPDDFRIFSPKEFKRKYYFGHISSWMMRNKMPLLLRNKAVLKAPFMDMIIFAFYKTQGDTIYVPKVTSVYNLNPNGLFRSKSSGHNRKKMIIINWYLYYYVHKDPVQFLRSIAYLLKRYLVPSVQSSN